VFNFIHHTIHVFTVTLCCFQFLLKINVTFNLSGILFGGILSVIPAIRNVLHPSQVAQLFIVLVAQVFLTIHLSVDVRLSCTH